MLSENERTALKQPIMTLRIIVFALVMGLVTFGFIARMMNANKPRSIGTNINYPVLAISVSMMFAALVVPRIMPINANLIPPAVLAAADPKLRDLLSIVATRQTKTIVGAALFEGAAFMNLIFFMFNAELVHAAAAAICVIGILAHFPITGRVEEQVEEQLRRRREEGFLG